MPENIGKSNCLVCGAGVLLKENRSGKLYYSCNGDHDENDRGCGSQLTIGRNRSQKLKAGFAAKATNDNEVKTDEHQRAEQHNEPEQHKRTGTFEDYF